MSRFTAAANCDVTLGRRRLGLQPRCLRLHPEQYLSPILSRWIAVHGERGEIVGDRLMYLKDGDARTPITTRLTRRDVDHRENLEGHFLHSITDGHGILWSNDFAPARLADEEIAVATCLSKMASMAWPRRAKTNT